jgi:hypothetical protein
VSTGAVLLVSLGLLAAVWVWWEIRTLKDETPGNHITAVVRAAMKEQPGPFMLLFFALGFLCGHLFWP